MRNIIDLNGVKYTSSYKTEDQMKEKLRKILNNQGKEILNNYIMTVNNYINAKKEVGNLREELEIYNEFKKEVYQNSIKLYMVEEQENLYCLTIENLLFESNKYFRFHYAEELDNLYIGPDEFDFKDYNNIDLLIRGQRERIDFNKLFIRGDIIQQEKDYFLDKGIDLISEILLENKEELISRLITELEDFEKDIGVEETQSILEQYCKVPKGENIKNEKILKQMTIFALSKEDDKIYIDTVLEFEGEHSFILEIKNKELNIKGYC